MEIKIELNNGNEKTVYNVNTESTEAAFKKVATKIGGLLKEISPTVKKETFIKK